jgi:hypothetical protein
MAGAMVEACTIGERAVISQQTVVRFCVLYPEAIASQYLMQQCVLGRGAVTTGGAFSMDLNFDGPIRVPLDGKPALDGDAVPRLGVRSSALASARVTGWRADANDPEQASS